MEKLIFSGAFLWLFAMFVLIALYNWQVAVVLGLTIITVIAGVLVLIGVLRTLDP